MTFEPRALSALPGDETGVHSARPVTSQEQTTAVFLVVPVLGCRVPGGFLYGNRT